MQQSIKDLCAPISARVMPKSATFNLDHTRCTNDEAFNRARISATNTTRRAAMEFQEDQNGQG